MAVILRVKAGSHTFRVRKGRYLAWKLERGPYGCWLFSFGFGQLGWELSRWT